MPATGAAIEKLCEIQYDEHQNDADASPTSAAAAGGTILLAGAADKGAMVRAARCLLASVTQVLLLADTVVVKQLLQAKDKVTRRDLRALSNFFASK